MIKKFAALFLLISLLTLPLIRVEAESEMSDYCVYDVSDVLDVDSWQELNDRAMELSLAYRCGVYAILLPGFEEYTHYDDDIAMAAPDVALRNGLGYGDDMDSVVLLIDTSTGVCAVGSTGTRGSYIFNDAAVAEFDTSIQFDVSVGDYDSAIDSFIAECETLFEYERDNGKAYLSSGSVENTSVPDSGDMLTDCVYDYAGILSSEQKEKLEKKAKYLSQLYEFGIYIYIVDDYNDIYRSSDVYYACEYAYENLGFGYGESNRDGIMLFMSMDERDYATYRTVGKGYYAITDYGLYELEEYFLGPFRSNDWYGGFENYLTFCDYLLGLAEKGTPLDYEPGGDNDPTYNDINTELTPGEKCMVVAPFSLIISLVVCLILRAKMKTANVKTQANDYIAKNGVRMNDSRDIFTHSNTSRTRVVTESSSSGRSSGGGGHSYSSFSGSHGGGHSGKF